ncbi:MAG: fumarylacetoacetate hydrolase family protein [Candidatus Rokubacteria bacterium]|nr:fumarylacetoacetate hydrolase family protein [Candidatus Rokubacteria bacterium]
MSEPSLDPFLRARAEHRAVTPPSETRALSRDEAYAVQDRLRAELVRRGERVIGWKAGFTSKATQAMFGADGPVCGFLLGSGVYAGGSEVPVSRFATVVVEAEIALVLGRDLAGPGVAPPQALLAVEGGLPALELVDFRYTGTPGATDLIADGVYANAIVLGSPLSAVRHLDLALEGLVYELNGAVAATNTAAEVMGSPINSLAWIANHLAERGLSLRAGDVVMTGSVSALLRPRPGDTIRATYTRLGSVTARFV